MCYKNKIKRRYKMDEKKKSVESKTIGLFGTEITCEFNPSASEITVSSHGDSTVLGFECDILIDMFTINKIEPRENSIAVTDVDDIKYRMTIARLSEVS